MIEEIWKKYKSHEVSSFGRIKRPCGNITLGWERNGYKGIGIQGKKYYVHRLVGKLFCEGWFEGALIDHIDHDPENNHYSNLRWVTRSQNVLHKKGVKSLPVYISDEMALIIVNLREVLDLNNYEIAEVVGLDRRNVSKVLLGRTKSKITGIVRGENNASV